MSTISDYDDIARVQGHAVLLYERLGAYQGTWIMLSRFEDSYYLWQDWYGSCSGCDAIEGRSLDTDEEVISFITDYKPFAIIPKAAAKQACMDVDTWKSVMPANERQDDDLGQFENEARLIVKLDQGEPLTKDEILGTVNQETRRHGIEAYGITAFLDSVGATVLDEDDRHDKLVQFEDGSRYLWLQDGSTAREYILRVPPETQTVLGGKAWSFNVPSDAYRPLVET